MMKFAAILFAVLLFSCSPSREMIYSPVERTDVDITGGGAGLVRTAYCDVYIQYMGRNSWKSLGEYSAFNGEGDGIPPGIWFQFIVVNTWNRPLVLMEPEIRYNGLSEAARDFSEVKDSGFHGSRFAFDLRRLWGKRRILARDEAIGSIDFDADTVEYDLDFIAPGDRVSMFRCFSRPPSGAEGMKISVSIKYLDMKKVIDFDITRFEYSGIESE